MLSLSPSVRKPIRSLPQFDASHGQQILNIRVGAKLRRKQRVFAGGGRRFAGNQSESAELAADVQEFLPPLLPNGDAVEAAQIVQGLGDGVAGGGDHRLRVT